jgi:ABC-type transport system involved in multi-copper enzyme maturation permease subunit
MSILLFTAISANEESDGRMQSLLSLPVSRARVYLEKYFATMLIVVVISISAIIAIWISLVILHESVDYWRVWQSIIGFSVLNLAYGTIAYVAAMFTGSKGWTLLLASGYAVVSLFVSTLAPAVDKLAPFDKLSLIHYYNNPQIMTNGLSVSDVSIQLFVILVLLAVGLVGFVKRDIKAN